MTYIVSCVGITGRLGSKNAFGRDKRPPWTKATEIHNQNSQLEYSQTTLKNTVKIYNKNCMWWSCLLTDQDEINNLHRGHSIDASYQVSVVAMFVYRSGPNEQSS